LERIAESIMLSWGIKRIVLAFAAGALAVLALPPFNFFAVLFVSFPVLVWLLDGASGAAQRGLLGRMRPAFVTGWWFGFGYFVAGIWWLGNALLVDANSCYAPHQAIEISKLLIDNGISHFEEPCPYWEYEQTNQVTEALSALPIDVTGGEQDCELPNWRWMIDMKAVDIVQPDICYLGGLTRTLRVADMAAKAANICLPISASLPDEDR